jgi:acetyl-CoA C-acetyltransferase
MVDRLRSDPGSLGMVTGLGGFATKHVVALYGTEPASGSIQWSQVQPDSSQERAVAEGYAGPASIETWTVMFDRNGGPETGIATCLTPKDERAWATTTEPELLDRMTTEDVAGVGVVINDGRFSF